MNVYIYIDLFIVYLHLYMCLREAPSLAPACVAHNTLNCRQRTHSMVLILVIILCEVRF